SLGRQRVQAPESVSALDGPSRQPRSGRLDARVAVAVSRAARYPRHSRGTLSSTDPLHQPGLAYGAGHYGVAAASRPDRPGAVRLRHLSSRDDERVRIQSRPAGWAVSAAWGVPATRA